MQKIGEAKLVQRNDSLESIIYKVIKMFNYISLVSYY